MFLESRLIHIEAFNTKTMRARTVGMTTRLYEELKRLHDEKKPDADDFVFNSKGWIHNQLKRACQAAGVADFRLQDARHCACSRLVGTITRATAILDSQQNNE